MDSSHPRRWNTKIGTPSPQPQWLTFFSRAVCSWARRSKATHSEIWTSRQWSRLSFPFQTLTILLDSDDLESISSRLSQAVVEAVRHSHPNHRLLPDLLDGLVKWKYPPAYLTQYAYLWCSAICERNEDLDAYKDLLVLALRLGFRRDDTHLDPTRYPPIHTEYHKRMIDVVFSTGDLDTIADALRLDPR